jgi:SAM-dependent methyltransferase
MRLAHLPVLRCPATLRPLECKVEATENDRVKTGELIEPVDGRRYPIVNFIPRFVPAENYASNFGLEWNTHARTQYDGVSGVNLTRKRFFAVTGAAQDMAGKSILECGSGSGRFTEVALGTGAFVASFDYSNAVEANYGSNGGHPNLLLVQASLYEMPFPRDHFDLAFCFGVLQHTPDPAKSFHAIPPMVKPGGWVSTDVYRTGLIQSVLQTRYWVRPFTKNHKDPHKLYQSIKAYVDFMWPLVRIIRKIPVFGAPINWRLMIADYSRELPDADDRTLKEWAYLNTFDALSPAYDLPQSLATFRRWHQEAGLQDVVVGEGDKVGYGWSGWVGRGRKPAAT